MSAFVGSPHPHIDPRDFQRMVAEVTTGVHMLHQTLAVKGLDPVDAEEMRLHAKPSLDHLNGELNTCLRTCRVAAQIRVIPYGLVPVHGFVPCPVTNTFVDGPVLVPAYRYSIIAKLLPLSGQGCLQLQA